MNNTFCSKCHRIPSQCCCSPVKELTDDELFKVYVDLQEGYSGDNFPVDLGRAILRKAQEK